MSVGDSATRQAECVWDGGGASEEGPQWTQLQLQSRQRAQPDRCVSAGGFPSSVPSGDVLVPPRAPGAGPAALAAERRLQGAAAGFVRSAASAGATAGRAASGAAAARAADAHLRSGAPDLAGREGARAKVPGAAAAQLRGDAAEEPGSGGACGQAGNTDLHAVASRARRVRLHIAHLSHPAGGGEEAARDAPAGSAVARVVDPTGEDRVDGDLITTAFSTIQKNEPLPRTVQGCPACLGQVFGLRVVTRACVWPYQVSRHAENTQGFKGIIQALCFYRREGLGD